MKQLEKAKRPLKDEASLATGIREKLARPSVDKPLAILDAEERVEDPVTLTLSGAGTSRAARSAAAGCAAALSTRE